MWPPTATLTVPLYALYENRTAVDESQAEGGPQRSRSVRTWQLEDLELLEHVPDATIAVDEQGLIVFANAQTERVFGYAPADLLGQSIEVLVPRNLWTQHEMHRALYQRDPHVRPMGAGLDLMGLRKDGVEIPVDIGLSPLYTSAGTLTIAAVRDVSDRKAIERDLRAAHQRLHRDFRAAASLQQSLLPRPELRIEGFSASWFFQPSEYLAGDSFDIFQLEGQRLGLYMLDVSGHGVVAALQSVALTRVLSAAPWPSTMLRLIDSPASVVAALNDEFPINPDTWQYFTFLCGVLDIARGEMRYATAGHPGPILASPGSKPRMLKAEGFPIGLFPAVSYDEYRVDLNRGDRVYFYSDGVTDAMNPEQHEFGCQRLLDIVSAHQQDDIDIVVRIIGEAVRTWAKGLPSHDDVSVLALELTQ